MTCDVAGGSGGGEVDGKASEPGEGEKDSGRVLGWLAGLGRMWWRGVRWGGDGGRGGGEGGRWGVGSWGGGGRWVWGVGGVVTIGGERGEGGVFKGLVVGMRLWRGGDADLGLVVFGNFQPLWCTRGCIAN